MPNHLTINELAESFSATDEGTYPWVGGPVRALTRKQRNQAEALETVESDLLNDVGGGEAVQPAPTGQGDSESRLPETAPPSDVDGGGVDDDVHEAGPTSASAPTLAPSAIVLEPPPYRFRPINSHRLTRILDPARQRPEPLLELTGWSGTHVLAKRGEVVRFSGEGGTGKSFFLLDLVCHMGDRLSDVKVNAQRCIWVDEEHDEDIFAERLALLGKNHEEFIGETCYLLDEGLMLDDDTMVNEFFHLCNEIQPDIIVLDSFSALSTVDENDNLGQRQLYNKAIKPLSREYGATVFVIDHLNKNRSGSVDGRVRGAGDKINQIERSWVATAKGDDEFVLTHGKVRRQKRPPKLTVSRLIANRQMSHMVRVSS